MIGTGNAARNHAKAINKISGSEIVTVYGSSKQVNIFARDNKIKKNYTDLDLMFRENNVDAVIIASIPSRHINDIMISAKYVDVIIVEKPLVAKPEDIEKIKRITEDDDKSISVVYQHRYNKSYGLLKKDLKGHKSKILHINLEMSQFRDQSYFSRSGKWRSKWEKAGGGVVMQQGIHWINFLCSIIGYRCIVENCFSKKKYEEVEDLASIKLKINNIDGDMFFSRITPSKETKLTIYAEDKIWEVTRIRFLVRNAKMIFLDKVKYSLSSRLPVLICFRRNLHMGDYADFLQDVVKNNSNGKRKSIFLDDSINDIKLIEKIYNSHNSSSSS